MPDTIHCATHGETAKVYVCTHLPGESFALEYHQGITPERVREIMLRRLLAVES